MLIKRYSYIVMILANALMLLTSCTGMTVTPSLSEQELLLPLSTPQIVTCETCAQATAAAVLTQEKFNANNQAAATAEVVRANAQATFNSANATLSMSLTQEQNSANYIAAQAAATAEMARANAQATVNSAGSTQIAAMTQSQYNLQITMAVGTQNAEALITQQNKDYLAASTQTAIANNIATQTQIAAATSQWYVDQTRQREEQRQVPITFMWLWCLPIFIVLLAGLILWGFWRWLKIQQANQRILENPLDRLPALAAEVPHHHHNLLPVLESDIIENSDQVTTPDDQVSGWVEEVKNQLLHNDEKGKDDNTNH